MDREAQLRQQLSQVLQASARAHEALVEITANPANSAAVVIDEAHRLAQLERREHSLLQELEHFLASSRLSRPGDERSLRQVVLDVLGEIETPQKAAFLRDYIWARDRIAVETRSFSALRRDERRSWQRNPGKRRAYIAPALNSLGEPLPSWMTRSDWPLERRVLISREHERLLEVERILALLRASDRAPGEAGQAFEVSLGEHAAKLLGTAPSFTLDLLALAQYDATELPAGSAREWRQDVEENADRQTRTLHAKLDPDIRSAAARLGTLPPDQQIWGRESQ